MANLQPGIWFSSTLRLTAAFIFYLSIIPVKGFAQTKPSVNVQNDAEILFLGTSGGPALQKDRSRPSTLFIVGGQQYLIDCGIGTIGRMVQADIQSQSIRTIFITHHHPDHDLGLAALMADQYFKVGPGDTINIYGPPQTKEFVAAAFRYISIPYNVFAAEPAIGFWAGNGDSDLRDPFKAHDIQPGKVFYQDGKIRVTAVENTHYKLIPARFRARMKSYSYRFETPYGVIVFTGDTGLTDSVVQLAQGADILVSQVGGMNKNGNRLMMQMLVKNLHWSHEREQGLIDHVNNELMDLQEVGELASRARVKSVLFYHYPPANPEAYVSEMKKYYSGPVFAPSDLDRYCLTKQADNGGTSKSVISLCQKHPVVH